MHGLVLAYAVILIAAMLLHLKIPCTSVFVSFGLESSVRPDDLNKEGL